MDNIKNTLFLIKEKLNMQPFTFNQFRSKYNKLEFILCVLILSTCLCTIYNILNFKQFAIMIGLEFFLGLLLNNVATKQSNKYNHEVKNQENEFFYS